MLFVQLRIAVVAVVAGKAAAAKKRRSEFLEFSQNILYQVAYGN